jgi:hypothetical protein
LEAKQLPCWFHKYQDQSNRLNFYQLIIHFSLAFDFYHFVSQSSFFFVEVIYLGFALLFGSSAVEHCFEKI